MIWSALGLVIIALTRLGIGVHLLLTRAERRGWIYFRTKDRPRPSSLGILEEIYQPSISHVVEQQVRGATEADQAESGRDR